MDGRVEGMECGDVEYVDKLENSIIATSLRNL